MSHLDSFGVKLIPREQAWGKPGPALNLHNTVAWRLRFQHSNETGARAYHGAGIAIAIAIAAVVYMSSCFPPFAI